MTTLTAADFESYFYELHGRTPYDWQQRLAQQAIDGTWPCVIDLPTGSGKTACLDIAVFALACQSALPKAERRAPMRMFFCVNRRVIVDEAHQRARFIAERLQNAEDDGPPSTLTRVAQSLRSLSTLRREAAPPLDVLELRGGIYRDNRWARSVTQPTIVCTTIDQLGSRLLFRGYGVSSGAAPLQASLIAYDSLVLLDEAHISGPFLQTLEFIAGERGNPQGLKGYLDPERWARQSIGVRPMVVVPMTATPAQADQTQVIRLEARDRENPGLNQRLQAAKPARLLLVDDIVESAVKQAQAWASDGPIAVGILVNRVATAKAIYQKLRDQHPDAVVELVIGSMRPIDRDRQAVVLRPLVGPGRPMPCSEKTSFVVATQCLEVGADYDFDALVTECASLDALRQRLGRLNRAGREIKARAAILMSRDAVNPKVPDPIYGTALPATWTWLREQSSAVEDSSPPEAPGKNARKKKTAAAEYVGLVDFGIDAFRPLFASLSDEGRARLAAPSASLDAPVLLPAYLDFLCQTSPRPAPDPDVALFIHGPQAGEPDVQVCWRADLIEEKNLKRQDWCEVVALLPPSSAECMTVPISRLRRWLTDSSDTDDQGDLLGTPDSAAGEEPKKARLRQKKALNLARQGVLWWRGVRDSILITKLEDLRPGDTLVLPVSAEGWNDLGHVPNASLPAVDVAEEAFRAARARVALRLHPSVRKQWPASTAVDAVFAQVEDSESLPNQADLRQLLKNAAEDLTALGHVELAKCYRELSRESLLRERYPGDRGEVVSTRRRLQAAETLPAAEDGEDVRSWTSRTKAITLDDHTRHVREEVSRVVGALPCDPLLVAYERAADLHDLGKADERFQAMLRRAHRTDAWLWGSRAALLAKSESMALTPQQREQARQRAELPEGFRHEMLSVQIAELGKLIPDDLPRDLILHLIAAHHGYARPFAPIVVESDPPNIELHGVRLSTHDRQKALPHRADSGVAERFWALTRIYGWWGLAYLEAILRLADQQASADEDADRFATEPAEASTMEATT